MPVQMTRCSWLLSRLLHFDSTDDYGLFAAVWEQIYGRGRPRNLLFRSALFIMQHIASFFFFFFFSRFDVVLRVLRVGATHAAFLQAIDICRYLEECYSIRNNNCGAVLASIHAFATKYTATHRITNYKSIVLA